MHDADILTTLAAGSGSAILQFGFEQFGIHLFDVLTNETRIRGMRYGFNHHFIRVSSLSSVFYFFKQKNFPRTHRYARHLDC